MKKIKLKLINNILIGLYTISLLIPTMESDGDFYSLFTFSTNVLSKFHINNSEELIMAFLSLSLILFPIIIIGNKFIKGKINKIGNIFSVILYLSSIFYLLLLNFEFFLSEFLIVIFSIFILFLIFLIKLFSFIKPKLSKIKSIKNNKELLIYYSSILFLILLIVFKILASLFYTSGFIYMLYSSIYYLFFISIFVSISYFAFKKYKNIIE